MACVLINLKMSTLTLSLIKVSRPVCRLHINSINNNSTISMSQIVERSPFIFKPYILRMPQLTTCKSMYRGRGHLYKCFHTTSRRPFNPLILIFAKQIAKVGAIITGRYSMFSTDNNIYIYTGLKINLKKSWWPPRLVRKKS